MDEVNPVSPHAYALMSHHLHVVLKIDAQAAVSWPDEAVASRWCWVFVGSDDRASQKTRIAEIAAAPELVAKSRDRLPKMSRFMKRLVEPIARNSNREALCTFRFSERRFRAHAPVGSRALLTAMVHDNLYPLRETNAKKSLKIPIGEGPG
ncbi:hypothetical protein C7S18_07755 [Ahniella affigens]|uniref:Transposase IS200-like domain-containing protein n=2 Tax=Ahniella affigens TaxID=2021234 RepID=A0A2P1PQI4_9GAMM|nr:hypothetical protein C7S18_07755 [Ahniella affigens]